MTRSMGKYWALGIVRVLVTLSFAPSALEKFTARERWVINFANWGYPGWFVGIVGGIEVIGLVALWIPATRRVAAGVLGAVMVGAVATLATHRPGPSPGVPLTFLVLLCILGFANADGPVKLSAV